MADGDNGNPNGIEGFADDLRQVRPTADPTLVAERALDDVAFHDFAFHEYLFPTEEGYNGSGLSDRALEALDDWQEGMDPSLTAVLADLLEIVERSVRDIVYRYRRPRWNEETVVLEILAAFYEDLFGNVADMLVAYATENAARIVALFTSFLEFTVRDYVYYRLYRSYPDFSRIWAEWPATFQQSYADWHEFVNHDPTEDLPDWAGERPVSIAERARREARPADAAEYPFEVFPARSVNLGLRLVYRQEWRPLGVQPGEIVKTIPLGPGDRMKASTKIVRRDKRTSTLESVTESETTTETTDSTKDSSEVVAEATDTFKWNVDAKASASFLIGSAEVSTSIGGSSEDRSRSTSSNLSEAMRKAASKMRRETKVVVSTENERSFEEESSFEVHNANNEIAVTYEYHRLQQQYEVFTSLAEVQSVIFVAEAIPAPREIDAAWVRRHDWIIAKALKDESLRATLNELIQDADDVDPLDPNGSANPAAFGNPFYEMQRAAQDRFASFSNEAAVPGQGGQAGLSVPDIYAEPQRMYSDYVREMAARRRANALRNVRRERLFEHIRKYVLHYCRAVWLHEDHDQRLLRYKKEGLRVPVEWSAPLRLRQIGVGGANLLLDYVPTGRTMPLWQIVDPTGPVGYVGNYAVFGVRPLPNGFADPDDDPRFREHVDTPLSLLVDAFDDGRMLVDLNAVLATMRAPYVRDGALYDPALRQAIRNAEAQANLTRDQIEDLLSYLPRLGDRLLDANGEIDPQLVNAGNPVTREEWGEYLYRKNGTRRFLVDSNNLYLNLRVGRGAALEPFKRAHRYLDVLQAYQDLRSRELRNLRREGFLDDPHEYDPDVEKVVIVGDPATGVGTSVAALEAALAGSSRGAGVATLPPAGNADPADRNEPVVSTGD